MRTLIIFILLLASWSVGAQTIGDHLNYIKQKQPTGVLGYQTDGTRYTVITDYGSQLVYFFDVDLTCDVIALKPANAQVLQGLVEKFNREYVVINPVTWQYYRTEDIIQLKLVTVDDIGRVFYIRRLE